MVDWKSGDACVVGLRPDGSEVLGRVLARAPSDEEAVLVVECDLALVERVRQLWPFLRDRRIDAYSGIERRFLD